VTRTRISRILGALFLAATASAVGLAAAAPTPSAKPLAAPDAPSDSQVDLGRRWYAASCEECHAVDEVSSEDFKLRWSGRSAFELFEQLATTMPEDTPGSLPRRAYVDIVAYLARLNADPDSTLLPDDDAALAARTLTFTSHPSNRR
jgi:mono/diheme cytochrome c family protein